MKTIEVSITDEERMVLAHALRQEIERVEQGGGEQYGVLSLIQAKELLSRISQDERDLVSVAARS